MTVSYTGDVANGSSFGCFWRILGRWKGSVYKLVWRELVVYLSLYFAINLIYRHGLDSYQRSVFEKLKVYCSKQIESIPMSFVLGFYVTLIVKRWWDQYWVLPLPDSLALYISASIHGQDERARILRRTIMRYSMLSYIIMLQRISVRVKKRFPTLQHLVDTGMMMESEKKIFDGLEEKTSVSKFWMPIVWASNLVNRARLEGRIQSDHMVQTILTELSDFRRRLGRVGIYDTVSVPLVYTQVVTLAVYTYFMAALIGRQWVNPYDSENRTSIYPAYELDLYFPIFLSLQFIFYIGWLKVAETLINPFGEDDDDFELNWLIDRHIQVSYMVVDEIHEEHPELLKDQYWEQVVPTQLPYNLASNQYRRREPKGSTASMKIKENETIYDNLATSKRHSMIPDEVYADYESVTDSPLVDNRKNWIQRQLSRVESFRSTSSSSSLFNRNRLQNQNGVLVSHMHNSGGHRLSLYDKLMNRRSSKDRNFSKGPPTAMPRMNGGTQMPSLIPHPHSRPRVPTPEVTKETQVNLMTTIPHQKSPVPKIYQTNSGCLVNHHFPITHTLSGGNGHNTPNGGIYNSRNMVQSSSQHNQRPISPTSKSSPPSYDSSDTPHVMLSPIEENDSSPYSTSSTNRSSKSSNYPTTTSIFGRKPSPPPPKEELPPIPILTNGLGSGSSSIEEHTQDNSQNTKLIGEIDGEEPYMTIDEVGETKSGRGLQTYREGQIPIPQQPSQLNRHAVLSRHPNNQREQTKNSTNLSNIDKIPDDASRSQSMRISNDQNELSKPQYSILESHYNDQNPGIDFLNNHDNAINNVFNNSTRNTEIENLTFELESESQPGSQLFSDDSNTTKIKEESSKSPPKDCEVFV